MFKDLLSVLLGGGSTVQIGAEFPGMVELAVQMYMDVNSALWKGAISEDLRTATYKRDIKINQMERKIRKRVLTHLATSDGTRDVAHCFVLINVVKDAERIGDYVKNLAEVDVINTESGST